MQNQSGISVEHAFCDFMLPMRIAIAVCASRRITESASKKKA
jgi:hypothetical protein